MQFTTPIASGRPAIQVWEEIRSGQLQRADELASLREIRHLLSHTTAPRDIPPAAWAAFEDFISSSSDDDLRAFICSFEWSTGSAHPSEAEGQVTRRLITDGYCTDDQHAQQAYERLFRRIFRTLAHRGEKALTHRDLIDEISRPTLVESDHRALVTAQADMVLFRARIGKLEEAMARQVALMHPVVAGVPPAAYGPRVPDLHVPLVDEATSRRPESANAVAERIEQQTWLALYGTIGSGKSTLAAIVARAGEANCGWVRFRGMSPDRASEQFDEAISALLRLSPQSTRPDWYHECCRALGSGFLVVLDDLPRLIAGDGLVEKLSAFARAARDADVHILSTSTQRFPSNVAATVGADRLIQMETPPLTDTDAADILRIYEAPSDILDQVTFLNNVARWHPALFTAVVLYLRSRQWDLSGETLDNLMNQQFAAEINAETIARLLSTVDDTESRNLLYRLNLKLGSVELRTARLLAMAPPTLNHVAERFNHLIGLWLKPDVNSSYVVSPLISALGNEELAPETRRQCYQLLGQQVLEKPQKTLTDAEHAIIYLVHGELYSRAGVVLAQALQALRKADVPPDYFGLLAFWWSVPLPEEMPLGLRLYIRGNQLNVGDRLARDTDAIVGDIQKLVSKAGPEEVWALLYFGGTLSHALGRRYFALYQEILRKSLQWVWTDALPFDVRSVLEETQPEGFQLEQIIWFGVPEVSSPEDADAWMTTLETMPPDVRAAALNNEMAEEGAVMLANRLWLPEHRKPESERRWNPILRALENLQVRAAACDADAIAAAAAWSRVVVLSEYAGEFDAAMMVAQEAEASIRSTPLTQYLFLDAKARALAQEGRYEEAAAAFAESQATPTRSIPFSRYLAALRAAQVAGHLNPDLALKFALRAVEISEEEPEIPAVETVRGLGELAVATWLTKGVREAFDPLERAVARLLDLRDDSVTWKSILRLVGHVSGYLVGIAGRGKPPDTTMEGEQYAKPFPGMFHNMPEELALLHNPKIVSVILAQMAMYAEAIGDDGKAVAWAERASRLAREDGQLLSIAGAANSLIPSLIKSGQVSDALDLQLEAALIVCSMGYLQDPESTPGMTMDQVLEVARANPATVGHNVRQMVSMGTVLPLVFDIARRRIADRTAQDAVAEDFVRVLRRLDYPGSEPSYWATLADAITESFISSSGARELAQRAAELEQTDESARRVIYLVGATVGDNIRPENAIRHHITVMQYLERLYSVMKPAFRQFIVPFLADYWTLRVTQAGFLFTPPALVKQQLAEAVTGPEDQRVHAIIRVVSNGLSLRLPDWVKEWLG